MIVLTFHGIGAPVRAIEPEEQQVWLTQTRFERVLDQVNGRTDVRITFDDGNQSDVLLALPALLKRRLSADFFIVTRRIGLAGFLDSSGIEALVASGMGIGSHGSAHRAWRSLSDFDLRDEVFDARNVLQRMIAAPVKSASCPFGAYDFRSLRTLREAGFEHVFTSDRQPAEPTRYLQPRYTIYNDDDDKEVNAILSGQLRRPQWLHDLRSSLKRWPSFG